MSPPSTSPWQRRRKPDDVPTPVAVAVSDFCRRARSPASGTEIRDALSAVSEDDDFRVRAITDEEPAASPLGPYALVDILKGASPALAAERERVGYYALTQALLSAGDEAKKGALAANDEDAPPSLPELFPQAPQPPRSRAEKRAQEPREPTLAEKIAPRKRVAADLRAAEEPFGMGGIRKGELPPPRGRYTRLDSPRSPIAELESPAGKPAMEALLTQHRHRFALLPALSAQYAGRTGQDLSISELDMILHTHGLLETQERRERELMLSAYHEHKGASGRVAWALDLRPADLTRLVHVLGLEREVEEMREHFRREALSPRNWTSRLDLLGRTKYLADLGITQRFTESLRQELRTALKTADAPDHEARHEYVARQLGVTSELLARTVEKLGLAPVTPNHPA